MLKSLTNIIENITNNASILLDWYINHPKLTILITLNYISFNFSCRSTTSEDLLAIRMWYS